MIPALNSQHLKQDKKTALSTKLLYASCLKSTRNSSPHWGCFVFSSPKQKESVVQRFRPRHIYPVVLISVTLKKVLYFNSHNTTQHLTLSTRAPLIAQLTSYLETKQKPHTIPTTLITRTQPLENLAFTVCTLHALFKDPAHKYT